MIEPHGSEQLNPLFVDDEAERAALEGEAGGLPSLLVSSGAAANAVMLGAGYFNPLSGFMNKADALAVCDEMRTTGGLFWPVPILNLVHETSGIEAGSRIALRDPNVEGNPVLAVMDVDAVESLGEEELGHMVARIFGTRDPAHPGVETFLNSGRQCVSGPLRVLNFSYFQSDFPVIVGRDHAGVGDYYGPFESQEIFERQVPAGALKIDIYKADHTAYSKKLNRVVMMRDAPDHAPEDFVLLSGTRVRQLLGEGTAPPEEFSRPEVAQILMTYYQSLAETGN